MLVAVRRSHPPHHPPAQPAKWGHLLAPQQSHPRGRIHLSPPPATTLLDSTGYLRRPVSSTTRRSWRIAASEVSDPATRAKLEVWLAECEISSHEPLAALDRLKIAERIAPANCGFAGLARFDEAFALFLHGRYQESADAFTALQKSRYFGYDRKLSRLLWSHSQACATYHTRHAALGIPEPPELDPLCGVSSLAVCMKVLGYWPDRGEMVRLVRHTGEGSSFQDILDACRRLGLHGKIVGAEGRAALRRVPKPLIAHVEHDHFIAVTRTDKSGVTYWCSDCGPWPGGQIHLTWKQWAEMEPDGFLAVSRAGSAQAIALDSLPGPTGPARARVHLVSQGAAPLEVAQAQKILSAMAGKVRQYTDYPIAASLFCGGHGTSAHCPPSQPNCPLACPYACSPDPVNVATGEEQMSFTDLVTYNFDGPNIVWGRSYYSLANVTPTGFGTGWTHPYNYRITYNGSGVPVLTLPNSATLTLWNPQSPPAPPSQTAGRFLTPSNAAVTSGFPFIVDWTNPQGSGNPATYQFTIYSSDKSQMVFQDQFTINGVNIWVPTQIINAAGKSIYLTWQEMTTAMFDYTTGSFESPQLQSISDSSGETALVIQYSTESTSQGTVSYISGVYEQLVSPQTGQPVTGRAIAYTPFWELNSNTTEQNYTFGISTVSLPGTVTNATTSPTFNIPGAPVAWQYGYIGNIDNKVQGTGGNPETTYALYQVSRPDPACITYDQSGNELASYGNGVELYSTDTINYDAQTGAVKSLTDTEGNELIVTPETSNGTLIGSQIDKYDSSGKLWGREDLTWDSYMDLKTRYVATYASGSDFNWQTTAGFTNLTYTYGSSQAPYLPLSAQDANGRTWSYTYDQYGNVLTSKTPYPTTTTYTYQYSNYPLGELVEVQEGSKAPTYLNYNWPTNGLLTSVQTPAPTNAYEQNSAPTTTISYDSLGNVKSVSGPGNGTVSARTVNFSYTSSAQPTEALGEPVSVSDELGNSTLFTYDQFGNILTRQEPSGSVFTYEYNLANQLLCAVLPATGNSGSGNAYVFHNYLYVGGPHLQTAEFNESAPPFNPSVEGYPPSTPYRLWTDQLKDEGELQCKADGSVTTWYTYDACFRPTSMATGPMAEGVNLSNFYYDLAGRLIKHVYNGGGTDNLYYDTVNGGGYTSYGDLVEKIDARGVQTNYYYGSNGSNYTCPSFNPDGLLSEVTFAPAAGGSNPYADQGVQLSYDQYDRLTEAVDAFELGTSAGSATYTYDDLDEVATMSRAFAGASFGAQTLTYSYNPDQSRYALETPAGTIWYAYWANGLMHYTTFGSETASYTYDGNRRLTAKTLPNGVATSYSYNAVDARTSQTTSGFAASAPSITWGQYQNYPEFLGDFNLSVWGVTSSNSWSFPGGMAYTTDSTNFRLGEEQSTRSNANFTYHYDFDASSSQSPSYSANLTEIRGNSNQAYNSLNQITTGSGSTAFAYDGNGNPTEYEGTSLGWDALNRMTSCGSTSDTYGADGLRASLTSGGATTYFLNDGTMPVVELSSSGAVSALNLFGADGIIGRETSSGAWSEYVFDLLGNSAIRTNQSGSITAGFAYDAYGWFAAASGSGAADPWMYQAQSGYYYDSSTTLSLCGHRFYDAGLARWLNRDPIGYSGGANLYRYVGGNPVEHADPSGLQAGEVADVFLLPVTAAATEGTADLLDAFGVEDACACDCSLPPAASIPADPAYLASANNYFAEHAACETPGEWTQGPPYPEGWGPSRYGAVRGTLGPAVLREGNYYIKWYDSSISDGNSGRYVADVHTTWESLGIPKNYNAAAIFKANCDVPCQSSIAEAANGVFAHGEQFHVDIEDLLSTGCFTRVW